MNREELIGAIADRLQDREEDGCTPRGCAVGVVELLEERGWFDVLAALKFMLEPFDGFSPDELLRLQRVGLLDVPALDRLFEGRAAVARVERQP
jgi:hypothetical protein